MAGSRYPLSALLLLLIALPSAAQEAPADDETMETDPAVIEQKVEKIIEEYEALRASADLEPTRRRRELARRLGTLPCEDAVKTLHKLIENDRDLRTVIFAMNSLCRIGDIKAIQRMYKHVLKESRKTVLPDYFGPAVSRARDPQVGPWLVDKVLDHPNKFLSLSAVEAVGALRTSLAREPLFKMLEKEQRKTKPDIHLVYEILRALGMIGGEGVKDLLDAAAADDDWRIREAAAEVLLMHHRDEPTIELMRKLLKDEVAIVREVAAVSAGEHKLEELFPELILLMREGNLRAKHKSYEAMKAISSQDFGYAPDVWAKWLQDKKKGELTEAGDIKDRQTITVATYYDFKIFSDRVLFVVDVSGSMKWPDYRPNRIDVAKRELVKAIRNLDEKTLFNVATFAGHVNMWNKKGEVPATSQNKKEALEWAEDSLLPRGATNTYDALMLGLELNPQIDTVFFLSDGLPSTGKYELPEEILVKLRYANRFRKVIFNTVALAMGRPSIEKAEKYEDPEEMAAFMKMIADENGGVCVDIRKPPLDLREE